MADEIRQRIRNLGSPDDLFPGKKAAWVIPSMKPLFKDHPPKKTPKPGKRWVRIREHPYGLRWITKTEEERQQLYNEYLQPLLAMLSQHTGQNPDHANIGPPPMPQPRQHFPFPQNLRPPILDQFVRAEPYPQGYYYETVHYPGNFIYQQPPPAPAEAPPVMQQQRPHQHHYEDRQSSHSRSSKETSQDSEESKQSETSSQKRKRRRKMKRRLERMAGPGGLREHTRRTSREREKAAKKHGHSSRQSRRRRRDRDEEAHGPNLGSWMHDQARQARQRAEAAADRGHCPTSSGHRRGRESEYEEEESAAYSHDERETEPARGGYRSERTGRNEYAEASASGREYPTIRWDEDRPTLLEVSWFRDAMAFCANNDFIPATVQFFMAATFLRWRRRQREIQLGDEMADLEHQVRYVQGEWMPSAVAQVEVAAEELRQEDRDTDIEEGEDAVDSWVQRQRQARDNPEPRA